MLYERKCNRDANSIDGDEMPVIRRNDTEQVLLASSRLGCLQIDETEFL